MRKKKSKQVLTCGNGDFEKSLKGKSKEEIIAANKARVAQFHPEPDMSTIAPAYRRALNKIELKKTIKKVYTFIVSVPMGGLNKHKKRQVKHNGYVLCKGNSLKAFKLRFASDIDVATKTTVLGLFDLRSFLNIGMLLTESEKAKHVRTRILDIVIATINEKCGGGTKYINHLFPVRFG